MIIDSHVHLKHGDAQKTEYSAETIVKTMDAVGIDKSIVFAMSTSARHSIEMAKEAIGKFPHRLIPYAYALPSYESVVIDQLDQAISEHGFRGIKIHAGECTLADYVIDPVMDLAGKRGVPCLIDCLGRYEPIERMAEKFVQTKIIVAHLGRYLCREEPLIERFIRLAEEHENVLLDASGVVIIAKIREAVDRIGSERVIFGTDGPHESPDTVTYAHTELDKIRSLNLKPKDEAAVLGGTIAGLLGL
jgi:predicted TIM-barrel fold metal-dependent hydrolase